MHAGVVVVLAHSESEALSEYWNEMKRIGIAPSSSMEADIEQCITCDEETKYSGGQQLVFSHLPLIFWQIGYILVAVNVFINMSICIAKMMVPFHLIQLLKMRGNISPNNVITPGQV